MIATSKPNAPISSIRATTDMAIATRPKSAGVSTRARIRVLTNPMLRVTDAGGAVVRELAIPANRNQAVGDAPAGSFSEQDSIRFADGLSGTILLDGELVVIGDLRIEGLGPELLTFDAGGQNRVFFIQSSEETSRPIEMFLGVTALYIVSAFAINRLMAFIEKRSRVPGFIVSASGGGH